MPSRRILLHKSETAQSQFMETTVLENGITVVSEFVPQVQSFSLGVWINTGSRDESESKHGVAHFLEHLLFRSTKKRSGKKLASDFESFGAYVNAFTTKEHTCVYVRALSPHLQKSVKLMLEMICQPALLPSEIDKEREVILEEIVSSTDEPEEYIFDKAESLLFSGHPLAHPIAGEEKSISSLKYSEIQNYFYDLYSSGNIVVSAAGNIQHNSLVHLVSKHYAAQNNNATRPTTRRSAPIFSQKTHAMEEQHCQQVHLAMVHGFTKTESTNRHALSIFNTLLGDGMSSRLYQRIREQQGLAYTVYSALQLLSDCGTIALYAASDEKNAEKILKMMKIELEKLAEKTIPDSELRRMKAQVSSSVVLALENMENRMMGLAKTVLEGDRHESTTEILSSINAVTALQLRQVATDMISSEAWASVFLRPKNSRHTKAGARQ